MDYDVLIEPDLKESVDLIKSNWRSKVLVIYAQCKVDYTGRAKSNLDYGSRLIITKPDGTIMIHGRTKREPINWQPPGCILSAFVQGDRLHIKSIRRNPKEIVLIECPTVHAILACNCEEGEFTLHGSEKEMVQKVIEDPTLLSEDFKPLKAEYPTPFGSVDLLGLDKEENLVVVEFKRATAQLSAVSQLKRYVDYFEKRGEKVRGVLVAPDITLSAYKLLKEYGFEYVKLDALR